MPVKNMKSILYVVVGIIIYIIIKLISHESRKKYYLNIAYEGMIKEKYLDSNNRGIPYIIVDGYNTNFQLEDNRNFKLIEVGD